MAFIYWYAILEALYEIWPAVPVRDKVIVTLLVYLALTVLEINRLEVSDIDLERGRIKIRANKKTQARVLSLKAQQILLFTGTLSKIGRLIGPKKSNLTSSWVSKESSSGRGRSTACSIKGGKAKNSVRWRSVKVWLRICLRKTRMCALSRPLPITGAPHPRKPISKQAWKHWNWLSSKTSAAIEQ